MDFRRLLNLQAHTHTHIATSLKSHFTGREEIDYDKHHGSTCGEDSQFSRRTRDYAWAYVIQYKNHVQQVEQENKRLGEKKERIQGMVDRAATNNGEVIEAEISSWLEKVEQMEGDIANFLHQQEDGESFRPLGTWRRMEVHYSCVSIAIGYLEKQEAWELFTKVTGDFGVNERTTRNIISKRCGGLPTAIVAVGAALKGKEEGDWQDALHQLEKCPLKYIEGSKPMGYTPLKCSYDSLSDKDAKSCFLLYCLFPEDAEISIDDLVRYGLALGFLSKADTLKAARNGVQAMVNMLKRSCLLLNGKNKNFVKMQDVIRDLAISITEEKQIEHGGGHDWPGQQQFRVDHDIQEWLKNDAWKHNTAISLRINDDNTYFPCGVLHCPLMHTLVLKSGKSSRPKIRNDFFKGMKAARVLDFTNMFFELPSSILKLDHLQMLRLNNCQLLGDLSTIQNLKNHIEILSFKGSNIEELPQEIGKLSRLQSLDLRVCKGLKVIPKGVISNLIHLEELYVARSFYKMGCHSRW